MGEYWYFYIADGLFYLLIGATIPLAIIYLVYFFRRRRNSGKPILFAFIGRLLLVLLIVWIVFALSGFYSYYAYPYIGEDKLSDRINAVCLVTGLTLGIIYLVKGIRKGKKLKAQSS